MLFDLTHYILDNWSNMPVAGPKPKQLTFTEIVSGPKLDGRVKFLFFRPADKRPFILAKFHRDPAYNNQLKTAYQNLSTFYNAVDIDFQQTLPRPINLVPFDNYLVMFESVVEGRAIVQELGQGRLDQVALKQHFEKAGQWLATFHNYKAKSTELIDWPTLITNLVQKYLTSFPDLSQTEAEVCAELENLAQDLATHALPATWLHGDFCHKNLMVSQNHQLRIVDWQYSATEALFARDLFHFPLLYAQWLGQFTRKTPPLHWLDQAFFQSTDISQTIISYLSNYLTRFQIPPIFTRLFFPLSIIFQIFRLLEVYGPPNSDAAVAQWRQVLNYYSQQQNEFLKGWPKLNQ
jgi:hypothetical protein